MVGVKGAKFALTDWKNMLMLFASSCKLPSCSLLTRGCSGTVGDDLTLPLLRVSSFVLFYLVTEVVQLKGLTHAGDTVSQSLIGISITSSQGSLSLNNLIFEGLSYPRFICNKLGFYLPWEVGI